MSYDQNLSGKNIIWDGSPLQEDTVDRALRPTRFEDFVGQGQSVKNLKIFIQAAQQRKEPLDHVLLFGPPGLGKTTLAHLIALESQSALKTTSGPIMSKPGDLAAILTNLKEGDVLFIDEVHRLPIAVEELLYSAMEDYKIDILIGEGPHARSLQLALPPFTLVGATTRSGLLSSPLRDRFGIAVPLEFYEAKDLCKLLMAASVKMNVDFTLDAARILSLRCRGTPRIALRLLRRIRDFASIHKVCPITDTMACFALDEMGITSQGLDSCDQRYLCLLAHHFQGGPTGLETLASALSETRDTVEDVIEPYLLQQGMIARTPRGRKLTEKGWQALEKNDGI
jgi:Holliday junction DNA helicase RuvB